MEAGEQCPHCGGLKLKRWDELDRDEQILANTLPSIAEFTLEERKKHRYCTRCWFTERENKIYEA